MDSSSSRPNNDNRRGAATETNKRKCAPSAGMRVPRVHDGADDGDTNRTNNRERKRRAVVAKAMRIRRGLRRGLRVQRG